MDEQNIISKTAGKKGLSVVMPCLNEEKTLEICIRKAKAFMQSYGIAGEVLIADNGSTDRSIAVAKKNGARVVHVREKGYGAALRGGIEAAEYEYIVMGDADDSYDFSDLSGFIEKLDQGYDLVMGNRFRGGVEPGAMPFSHQYIGNPLLSGLGRIFFKTDISDFHCGLRAFRRASILKLGLNTSGMEFASEMVVKATLFQLKIGEIPCKLYPDGRDRPPHLRSIPDGLRHLEFLLMYSPNWLFAYPGLAASLFGFLLVILIFFQPLQLGRIQFEVTTMYYSALMMLIGVQMLQFSMFTNVFAKRVGQFPQDSFFMQKISRCFEKKGYWIALAVITIGAAGVVYTVYIWGQAGFGQLNTTWVCKAAILFGSFLAIGVESLLFTLFLRILKMGRAQDHECR